jgi:peptidoglycan/xylan/chitin deacetylase (PgdA/CDA1 family)
MMKGETNPMKWTDRYRKAVTFSYDDGVLQDRRLVDILNRYGLKATFNVNSGLGRKNGTFTYDRYAVSRFDLAELKSIYVGHEVAMHTVSHPPLTGLGRAEIVSQIERDREAIEAVFGVRPIGLAYPFGDHDDTVVAVLKDLGVAYARTVTADHSFRLQTDLLRFRPTAHHNDPAIFDLIRAFLDEPANEPRILYIWGHSYEFDGDGNWNRFESICRHLADRDDVFAGTNAEVLLDRMPSTKPNRKG